MLVVTQRNAHTQQVPATPSQGNHSFTACTRQEFLPNRTGISKGWGCFVHCYVLSAKSSACWIDRWTDGQMTGQMDGENRGRLDG